MRFSERIGKRSIKTLLQVESIDEALKNGLWNILLEQFFDKMSTWARDGREPQLSVFCRIIWKEFYKNRVDELPVYSSDGFVLKASFIDYVRKWYFKAEWFEIYDLIEFILPFTKRISDCEMVSQCNYKLEAEKAGYRIVNGLIVQITSEDEIQSIEEAVLNTGELHSVNTHLMAALDNLADRESPNYRNSIKESISAVESFCKHITNDPQATLGKALSEIEKRHQLHGALKSAFASIYGYTSDSSGIRHALLESDNKVEFEDAKFMLVVCSAFINYLKVKIQ